MKKMRMISSSNVSSCFFICFLSLCTKLTIRRWRCWVSTTLPAGTCYALRGQCGCDMPWMPRAKNDLQDGLSLRSCVETSRFVVVAEKLKTSSSWVLETSEAFRILSRLDLAATALYRTGWTKLFTITWVSRRWKLYSLQPKPCLWAAALNKT